MTDRSNPSLSHRAVSRRAVLGGIGVSAAALGSAHMLRGRGSTPPSIVGGSLATATEAAAAPEDTGRLLPGAVDGRVLVVVDMRGGNDGLSLLAPVADGRYHDLRPTLAISEEAALWLDDDVALHPSMARLHQRNLTMIEGVGPTNGDLSHFAMTERWERGDAAGSFNPRTGFLGRLTDALDDDSPLVGVSLSGYTNHLTNRNAATLAMGSPDDLWFLQPNDWFPVLGFRNGVQTFAADGGSPATVVDSYARLLELGEQLATDDESEEEDWEDPMFAEGGELGQRLATAATLISADVGTRVVYVGYGDFDTHVGHEWKQADNLRQLDAGVDGFLRRIEAAGASDRVLVATISEFGRRVGESDGGLDHGSASTMMLAGPVDGVRLGERPDLGDLDDDGNLRTAIAFDRYLATLAEEWLGVEAASVLPEAATPLGVFG